MTLVTALSVGTVLVLLLFRHWVTRHLAAMAAYTRGLNLDSLDTPLILDRRNQPGGEELDEVAASINRMRSTIVSQLAIRQVHEAELQAHREQLEQMVAARTEALEAQRDAVQRLANTDHLTGVLSRRYFYDCIDREIARATRDGTPLSVLMLDIDHFKRINDTYGHPVGDLVLKAFAAACQAELPATAIFGRLGGEEFALILPGTSFEAALAIAEVLRSTTEKTSVSTAEGAKVSFTVSSGLAVMDALDADVEALLKRCDEALYTAKRQGRNRVVTHVPAHPSQAASQA